MSNLFFIILTALISLTVNSAQITSTPAIFANNHPVQDAIKLKETYVDATISSSTDPFAAKTNKYCESSTVMICALNKGIHVATDPSSTPTASNVDYLVLANTCQRFVCSPSQKYFAVIENSATATLYLSELD